MTPFKGINRVTSPYGWRTLNGVREFHYGQDIVGDNDWNVRAIWDCVKVEAVPGYNGGRGNLVRLYYNNTLRVICQHLNKIYITTGQKVKQGDKVGLMGQTGYSFGAHLHIEVQVYKNGGWYAVEPWLYTEVPNTVGKHAGNDNLDNAQKPEPAPQPVVKYDVKVGLMSVGDKNTMEAIGTQAGTPAPQVEYMLNFSASSEAAKDSIEAKAKSLGLPVTVTKK